jgi:hypothetical protein
MKQNLNVRILAIIVTVYIYLQWLIREITAQQNIEEVGTLPVLVYLCMGAGL